MNELGRVRELVQYPVKSMAGVPTESAFLGWHGLAGDRRFAFRRLDDVSGFPWLTASRVAELLLYRPVGLDETSGEPLPTHVRTPDGRREELRSLELQREVSERLGSSVELMAIRSGIFDAAPVSVITLATIAGIGGEAGVSLDRRRFRANIVLDTGDGAPFLEDGWVGGTLVFGGSEPRPAVRVTERDVRCMMINLDPDTATQDARVLKTVVRLNETNAGVYGTVAQTGTIRVGDPVSLVLDARV
ncbi:MAG TPA: MOSC domain-containing protein [Gemmatimonadaceae bacterium]|nr:MOSC domain-containing protein [Gemmatimonadaceae bacterium]